MSEWEEQDSDYSYEDSQSRLEDSDYEEYDSEEEYYEEEDDDGSDVPAKSTSSDSLPDLIGSITQNIPGVILIVVILVLLAIPGDQGPGEKTLSTVLLPVPERSSVYPPNVLQSRTKTSPLDGSIQDEPGPSDQDLVNIQAGQNQKSWNFDLRHFLNDQARRLAWMNPSGE